MIKEITTVLGSPTELTRFSVQSSEPLDIALTVTDDAGAEINLTGLEVKLQICDEDGENLQEYVVAGAATGPYEWHFHGTAVAAWATWRRYAFWVTNPTPVVVTNELLPADALDAVPLSKPSFVRVLESIAAPGPWRFYRGAGAAGLSASQIEALGYSDTSSRSVTLTMSPTAQYCYLTWLSALGTPAISVDGIDIDSDLTAVSSLTLHDITGATASYKMRRTTLAQTGTAIPFLLEF